MTARALLERTHFLLERQREHPFVRGLGDGSLPLPAFQRWIVQDWHYLQGYARSVARVAALAPDLPAMTRWADLLHLTVHQELDGHRAFAARFGVDDLDRAPILPTTANYARFLIEAAEGSYAIAVAAHLPCAWDYVAVAQHLRDTFGMDGPYGAWISQYVDPAFAEAAEWLAGELDRTVTPDEAFRIAETFTEARHFEWRFWEMCWAGDGG